MDKKHKEQFAFITKYNGLSNVLISEIQIVSPRNIPDLVFPTTTIKAIWDTGATNSCISNKLAKQLGLIPISKIETNTAGGIRIADVYLVDIILPNRVGIPSVQVTGVELLDPVDALIGMDIIIRGDLAISNFEGKTSFSFRFPSLAETNYVQKINDQKKRIVTSKTKEEKKKARKTARTMRKKSKQKK